LPAKQTERNFLALANFSHVEQIKMENFFIAPSPALSALSHIKYRRKGGEGSGGTAEFSDFPFRLEKMPKISL